MIIAVIGPDGSGKTTYAHFLLHLLNDRNYCFHYPFNYFLLRKILNGVKSSVFLTRNTHSNNRFTKRVNQNPFLKFWPLIALVDNYVDYFVNIRIARNVICERYYYDLATSFLEFGYSSNWLYQLYIRCIPPPELCFVCIASPDILQQRETGDAHEIGFFQRQVVRYMQLSKKNNFILLDTYTNDKEECQKVIEDVLSHYKI